MVVLPEQMIIHEIPEVQVVGRVAWVLVPQTVSQKGEPKRLNVPDGTEPHTVVHTVDIAAWHVWAAFEEGFRVKTLHVPVNEHTGEEDEVAFTHNNQSCTDTVTESGLRGDWATIVCDLKVVVDECRGVVVADC